MSKSQLDSIEEWYCEDCIARIKREEDDQVNEENIDDQEEFDEEAIPEEELACDDGDVDIEIDQENEEKDEGEDNQEE